MLAFRPVTSLVGITSTFFERRFYMPLGLDRVGDYRDGTPINTITHNFGNPVTWETPDPAEFGNPIPSDGTNENLVTWLPTPNHFGNPVTLVNGK
jgi:hypothetical protein